MSWWGILNIDPVFQWHHMWSRDMSRNLAIATVLWTFPNNYKRVEGRVSCWCILVTTKGPWQAHVTRWRCSRFIRWCRRTSTGSCISGERWMCWSLMPKKVSIVDDTFGGSGEKGLKYARYLAYHQIHLSQMICQSKEAQNMTTTHQFAS